MISPLFSPLETCQGVYQWGVAGPANQRLLRAQGINSADPGLAWVRHPGYPLCPGVLSFRLLWWGGGGGQDPQRDTFGNLSTNLPGAREIKTKWSASRSCLGPSRRLPLHLVSKPMPLPQGTAHLSELSPPPGMLQPPLLSNPSRHPPPQIFLDLGLWQWLFLCLNPLPRSLKGFSSRSPGLFSNVTSQRGLPWPPFLERWASLFTPTVTQSYLSACSLKDRNSYLFSAYCLSWP